MWKYTICNALTGVKLSPVVPFGDPDLATVLNGGRNGSAKFSHADPVNKHLDWETLATPWANLLIGEYSGVIKYAFYIEGDDYDDDEGVTKLTLVDVWGMLGKRTTFGENGYSGNHATDVDLPIYAASWRMIISKLIWSATIGPGGNYGIPIAKLPDESGSHDRHYYDWNFTFIGPEIEKIAALEGGPDVDFEGTWLADGAFEWVPRVGSDAAPDLVANQLDFTMGRPNSGLTKVTRLRDGSKQATSSFAVGEGTERSMLVATSRDLTATIPALEGAPVHKTEKDMGVLQKIANGERDAYRNPTVQWGMSLVEGGPHSIKDIRKGTILSLYYSGHRRIPDGEHKLRVIGYSGAGQTLTLAVQPYGG